MKNYILIQNLANGLASPFMSFLATVIGVPNVGISIVSSASSFFSGVVQLPLRRVRRVEQLLKFSTLLLAVLWFIMAFIAYGNPIMYLITYVLIAGVGGANSFAWALIMERLSRGGSRGGWVLANFAFYGSIGSLLATLITGVIVGSNYVVMHYVFMTTASLIFINAINAWSIESADPSDQVITEPLSMLRSNRKLTRFLLINTLFAIVWSFAWPLFPLAQVYLLNMNVEQLAIVNVISGVSTLALQRFVGRWFDRNRKLVMLLGGRLLLVTFPLSYALANNVYVIYLANTVAGGFTNSASNVAYISFVYDNSEDRRTAVSLYNLFYGVGTLIGSLIGGALVTVVANYVGLKDSIRYMLLGDATARALTAMLYVSV